MKLTLVSSCGLVLEQDGKTLLVDALNQPFRCFYALPAQTFADMLAGSAPYADICGILCTHAHPDHYHAAHTAQLREAAHAPAFVPQDDTPAEVNMQLGPFAVEFHRFAHLPVPGWEPIAHGVYLITAGAASVYLTADAVIDPARHRAVLHGRSVSLAFWNGQYLSYPESRELLLESAERNAIYHIPADEQDASGIRRKCERNLARYGDSLPGVSLLEHYPSELNI